MTTTTPTRGRDAGLVAGIGLGGLVGNFVGFIIGGAIFVVPRDIAAALGPWGPLGYVAGAIVMGAIMLCFAEAAARVPTSGGIYGFATTAFGNYAGWLTGALNWASNALASAAGAVAAVAAASLFVPALGDGIGRAAAIVALYLGLVLINIRSVASASRFISAATVLKLVPIVLFLVIGAAFVAPANLIAPLPAGGDADIGRAAILGLFMFTGIEAGLGVAGEVRNPARTIPRAIGISLMLVTLLYIGIQTVAQGLIGNALADAPSPLAAALGSVSPALGAMMAVGAMVSIIGWLASDMLSSPRVIFAAARDGYLPALFGRLDARHHAPQVAVTTHAIVIIGLALTGSFKALVIASTLVTLIVYVIGCAAALKLRAADVALAGPVSRIPGLWPAAFIAFGASAWLAAQSTRDEALAIAGLVGVVTVLYRLRRKPQPFTAA